MARENSFGKMVANIMDFIKIIREVDQFLSGVFIAYKKREDNCELNYETEDVQFRDFGNAFIEIRAYDTTCFEIYTSSILVSNLLENKYKNAK